MVDGASEADAIVVMGRIAAAYGVHGMVHVQPLSEDPLALVDHPVWWLRPRDGGGWRECPVESARPHGGALVATLRGVATREAAAALRGTSIGIARSALPALAQDELYWSDLAGYTVVNRAAAVLGKVVAVMDNGAHAILQVGDQDAAERLIPWVPQYVLDVDRDQRRIAVDWPADY